MFNPHKYDARHLRKCIKLATAPQFFMHCMYPVLSSSLHSSAQLNEHLCYSWSRCSKTPSVVCWILFIFCHHNKHSMWKIKGVHERKINTAWCPTNFCKMSQFTFRHHGHCLPNIIRNKCNPVGAVGVHIQSCAIHFQRLPIFQPTCGCSVQSCAKQSNSLSVPTRSQHCRPK